MPTKDDCLERWRAARPRRRQLAQMIHAGARDYDPNWPNWVVYDIRAEIALIKAEAAARKREIDLAARRREAHDMAKQALLL